MARTDSLSNYLTDVATAIKNKKGDQTPINASDFDTEITNLPSGGSVTPITLPTDVAKRLTLENITTTTFTQTMVDTLAPITEIVKGISIPRSAFMNNSSITDLSGLKNCVVYTGDSDSALTPLDLFYGCSELTTLPTLNWADCTLLKQCFNKCRKLLSIPSGYFTTLDKTRTYSFEGICGGCNRITNINELATIKPFTIRSAFSSCVDLVDFPELDLSELGTNGTTKSNTLYYPWQNCESLSENSLHNIIKTLCTAPSGGYTGTKTLQFMGLTNTQVATCVTFDEWATLYNAGWRTGY